MEGPMDCMNEKSDWWKDLDDPSNEAHTWFDDTNVKEPANPPSAIGFPDAVCLGEQQ